MFLTCANPSTSLAIHFAHSSKLLTTSTNVLTIVEFHRGKYFAERGRLCLGHFWGAPGQNS